ncbi:MAG: PaaI family thioesterase [Agarilytica sp.]
MSNEDHYRRLERMYDSSPINTFFNPTLVVEEGYSTIDMMVEEKFFHAAHAVHGAVYFKMLDDAAWFAVNSLEPQFFVLTSSFTTYLTRPISQGKMTAIGEVVHFNRTQFIAEAVVYDEDEEEIARANGIFVRSTMRLEDTAGYKDAP